MFYLYSPNHSLVSTVKNRDILLVNCSSLPDGSIILFFLLLNVTIVPLTVIGFEPNFIALLLADYDFDL
jgi:hypothetical protein